MKLPFVIAGLLALASPACAAEPAIAQAIAAPDRPAADVARDAARHTADILAFAGAKPNERIVDFVPGTGFFTRLFSHIAGPHGHVFAVTPAELAHVMPKLPAAIAALATQPAYANVSAVVEPTGQTGAAALAQGGPVDLVWTSLNYHDVYGFFGAAQAQAADAAIFRALKPGGIFVVIDHVGLPGSAATAPTSLHRIDPDAVKSQILAAGFILDATSDVLRNPADPHTASVFTPGLKGHTDQFAFRFRKPAR